ncbi:MAG: hypothetical protein QXO32_08040 [Candidatus Bathyarchaeia archaeon]
MPGKVYRCIGLFGLQPGFVLCMCVHGVRGVDALVYTVIVNPALRRRGFYA